MVVVMVSKVSNLEEVATGLSPKRYYTSLLHYFTTSLLHYFTSYFINFTNLTNSTTNYTTPTLYTTHHTKIRSYLVLLDSDTVGVHECEVELGVGQAVVRGVGVERSRPGLDSRPNGGFERGLRAEV